MSELIPAYFIERRIYLVRGRKVMLDQDLGEIYGVPTKRLNEQVRRNSGRFPEDFMFRLTMAEAGGILCLRSQFATSKRGRGGRRYLHYAFTEHGAVMLASVLNSPTAVQASVQIVRAFVRLREMVAAHKELGRRLTALERVAKGHDAQIRSLFDAIRDMMEPAPEPARRSNQYLRGPKRPGRSMPVEPGVREPFRSDLVSLEAAIPWLT